MSRKRKSADNQQQKKTWLRSGTKRAPKHVSFAEFRRNPIYHHTDSAKDMIAAEFPNQIHGSKHIQSFVILPDQWIWSFQNSNGHWKLFSPFMNQTLTNEFKTPSFPLKMIPYVHVKTDLFWIDLSSFIRYSPRGRFRIRLNALQDFLDKNTKTVPKPSDLYNSKINDWFQSLLKWDYHAPLATPGHWTGKKLAANPRVEHIRPTCRLVEMNPVEDRKEFTAVMYKALAPPCNNRDHYYQGLPCYSKDCNPHANDYFQRFSIEKIYRIEDDTRFRAFSLSVALSIDSKKGQPIPVGLKSDEPFVKWLFHGTRNGKTARNIIERGFCDSFCQNGTYGPGHYFSPMSETPLWTYAGSHRYPRDLYDLFLCQGSTGWSRPPDGVQRSDYQWGNTEFDSIFAAVANYHVIPYGHRVLPCYYILLSKNSS